MTQPWLQRRFLSSWRQWLGIALALGMISAVALTLALWRQETVAKDCRRETPLPTDVRLVAPGADVPEAIARFAGAWSAAAEWGRGLDPVCLTLVVEEVLPNGYARVIFSYAASPGLDLSLPDFLRVTGRIVDGVLRFQLPSQLTYRFVGETLQGSFEGGGSQPLTQVADLSLVGCGERVGGPPKAPPSTGPRDQLTAA